MEKVRVTIKKLLALANDANDHESQVALLKAQELMLKHNLNEAELDEVESVAKLNIENRVIIKGKPQLWLYELATIISRNFKVKFYYTPYHNSVDFHFLGRGSDVDIAEITFNYAWASVKQCSRDFMQLKHIKRKYKRKFELRRDYIAGYLQGLHKKFVEQVQNKSFSLALTIHPAVIEEHKALGLVKGKDTSHEVKDEEAYRTGFAEGLSFGTNLTGIEGQ